MKHSFLIQDKQIVGDVLRQAPWGVVLCTGSGEVKFSNSAAASILNSHFGSDYTEAALLGRRIPDLIPGIDGDATGEQQIEFSNQKASTLQVHLSQINEDGESCIAVYIESPHRRLERERLLERQASTDELSDLYNRRAFQRNIESHQNRALSLALIDIDHFKKVNDEHGHLAGDDLVRLIGRLLREHFSGPSDLASRMGGDEFSVLVETSSPEQFVAQLEGFRRQLSSSKVPGTDDLYATVSCGAVIALEAGISSRTLLTIADRELYKAKDSGRNKLSWTLLQPHS